MSWKERRIIAVLLTILGLLAAALLIVLSMRYRAKLAAQEGTNVQPGDASSTQVAYYTALSYENGSTTLSFALNESGGWYWADDPAFPLNSEAVSAILTLVDDLNPQQTLTAADNLEEYGLNDPDASLTAAMSDGSTRALTFGKATTDGASRYCQLTGDTANVYIFDNTLYNALLTPIYDMMVLPTLPMLAEVSMQSVVIEGPAPEGLLTALSALRTEGSDTVTWRSSGANVTDDATVQALLEDLRTLALEKCLDYRPSDEAATLCGFDAPSAKVTVAYTSATGANETFILTVGNHAYGGNGRCVRVGEDSSIYLLPTALLDPLMRVAAGGLEQ